MVENPALQQLNCLSTMGVHKTLLSEKDWKKVIPNKGVKNKNYEALGDVLCVSLMCKIIICFVEMSL